MPEKPKFFNWSLKNLLSTIPDPLEQSRVKILYTFLILSILKVLIVIPLAYHNKQFPQLIIALFLLIAYTLLTKLLLSHKKSHDFTGTSDRHFCTFWSCKNH